jgi:hypothetical protein
VKRLTWQQRCRGSVVVGIGAAVIAFPVYALLLKLGGQRAFNSLFVWPITSTQLATLPWPPLVPPFSAPLPQHPLQQAVFLCGSWAFYFPLAALALGAWRLLRWRSLGPTEADVGLWLLLVSGGFYFYASRRSDYYHLLPLLVCALLFTALCLTGALGEPTGGGSRLRPLWVMAGLLIAVPALAALFPEPLAHRMAHGRTHAGSWTELPGTRGAGIFARRRYARHYAQLVDYFQTRVPPGEKIYVGAPRHDRFTINDPLVYFLGERDPGTYYWCLDAGVTTRREIQREMRRQLTVNGVNTVVVWTDAAPDRTNTRCGTSGAGSLDRMLATEFSPALHMPSYRVLRRVLGGIPSLADATVPSP